MNKTKAYSAASKTSPLASTVIPRRDATARDVQGPLIGGTLAGGAAAMAAAFIA